MTKTKEDLTGRKFGHLKVIKQVEDSVSPSGARRAMWLCECDCKNHTKIIVSGDRLRKGKKTHCGCQSIRGMKLNLVGKHFGKLTVNKDQESLKEMKLLCGYVIVNVEEVLYALQVI